MQSLQTCPTLPAGWQDIGPDGIIESTGILGFTVSTTGETGAAEIEIWPGAPGTQTLKTLISANNTDIQTTPQQSMTTLSVACSSQDVLILKPLLYNWV
jgi:hypothetical protein